MNSSFPGKILLVDDEQGIRKVLEISLRDLGYDVMTAASGEEALSIVEVAHPCVVITDIKMPGMDGVSLLKKLKFDHPDIEVIMVTGHSELDLAIQSIQAGAVDFVTKPVDTEVLDQAIKRSFDKVNMNLRISQYTRNLEEMVHEKESQLKKSDRLIDLGQTVAGIAHGIKSIVSGLKGGAFILEQGLTHDKKSYLEDGWQMIKGNLEKITTLSLDMLNYSKLTDLSIKQCNPNLPVLEVVNLLEHEAGKKNIRIVKTCSEILPPVYFDPEDIHCALLNLLTNAIEAYPESCGITPKEIHVETREKEGWGVEYEIRDNAGGMDDTIQPKVFKSFFTTKGKKGTGFGLMLVKKIVEEHHGELEFTALKGKGSCFKIRIPKEHRVEVKEHV
ncbi:MAG: response regulator [Proteobacteria bacterium]|nr:response regulator [Pseudomonadota bacterium]